MVRLYSELTVEEVVKYCLNDSGRLHSEFATSEQMHYITFMDIEIEDILHWWTEHDEIRRIARKCGVSMPEDLKLIFYHELPSLVASFVSIAESR